MFHMGVEWTIVPRIGAVNIQVTQPNLTVHRRPRRSALWRTAAYHDPQPTEDVPLEYVVVMLPEALGGERANRRHSRAKTTTFKLNCWREQRQKRI